MQNVSFIVKNTKIILVLSIVGYHFSIICIKYFSWKLVYYFSNQFQKAFNLI